LIFNWLLEAMRRGLDICSVLDSKICSARLDANVVEHFARWPIFHTNDETCIENYESTFNALLHDEEAYNSLFSQEFPLEDFDPDSGED
jgi:hypothetical protein